MDLDPFELCVGAREVEELEDAERALAGFGQRLDRVDLGTVDHDQLAGFDLPLERRADEVERARLRGEHRVVADPSEHERAEAVRVAEAEELSVGEPDDGGGALELRHRSRDGLLQRPLVLGDQRGDHLAVGGRADFAVETPSRSKSALIRLPLCPRATRRALP